MIAISGSLFCGKIKDWGQISQSSSRRPRCVTQKFGKRRVHRGGMIQKCEPQERVPWAPKFEERTQNEILRQERCARKAAWNLAKDVFKLKKGVTRYVLLSCRSLGNASTLFEQARRTTIRNRLWSFYAYVKQEGLELRRVGYSQEIQNHHIPWSAVGICEMSKSSWQM